MDPFLEAILCSFLEPFWNYFYIPFWIYFPHGFDVVFEVIFGSFFRRCLEKDFHPAFRVAFVFCVASSVVLGSAQSQFFFAERVVGGHSAIGVAARSNSILRGSSIARLANCRRIISSLAALVRAAVEACG